MSDNKTDFLKDKSEPMSVNEMCFRSLLDIYPKLLLPSESLSEIIGFNVDYEKKNEIKTEGGKENVGK